MTRDMVRRLQSWEGLLLVLLIVVVVYNAAAVPGYLGIQNQINLFELSVEKAIAVLAMTFVIVSAEIGLSVASSISLPAVPVAWLPPLRVSFELGIVIALAVGALGGLFN